MSNDLVLDETLEFLDLFPEGVPLPVLPAGELPALSDTDFDSVSPSTSLSSGASPPFDYHPRTTTVSVPVCTTTSPQSQALPSLGKRSPPSLSGSSGGSDADMTEAPANKRQERLRRNRESAAKSRQRQKERVKGLETSVADLRAQVNSKDQQLQQLRAENSLLRTQVSFLQGLVGKTGPSTNFPGVPPLVDKAPATTAVMPTAPSVTGTATTGVVLLAVVFSFALCVVPGVMDGGVSQWVSGAPAMQHQPVGGPLAAGYARSILSNDSPPPPLSVDGGDSKPPVPHMWSPTAAVTFALYALGMQSAARSVLTHVVAVAVGVACLAFAKASWDFKTASSAARSRQPAAAELPVVNLPPRVAQHTH